MNHRLQSFLLLILLSLIWGSSFFLIKKSLLAFEPLQVMGLRITISAMAFLPFLSTQIKRVRKKALVPLFVVGMAGSAIPAFCYAFAQTHISSVTTGILNSLTPLFTLFVGVIFFQVKNTIAKSLGVIFGLAGAILLITHIRSSNLETNIFYASFIVLGTICYAISGNVVKEFLVGLRAFPISVISYCMIGPFGILALIATRVDSALLNHPQAWFSLGAIALLALGGTVLASLLYFQLVQRTTALFASLVSYLIPVIAMIFGFLDGESIGSIHFIGLILISSGVYLAQLKKNVSGKEFKS